jgi:hypothetical protein
MFRTATHDTRTDEARERYRKSFDTPFMPTIRRIDEMLGRLLKILERKTAQSSQIWKENSHASFREGC